MTKPLQIDLWAINYFPEQTGIAVYTTDLCRYFAELGTQIRVTTAFPYYPMWKKQDRAIARTDTIHGIIVRRNWLFVPAHPSVWKRVLHELSFAISSGLRQLLSPPPDVYIVVSPPLVLGLAAVVLGALKRRPFLFYVQDLQPDAAIKLNMLNNPLIIRAALKIEKLVYARADAIIAIGSMMADTIASKGVDSKKIHVIHNWVPDSQQPIAQNAASGWRHKFGLPSNVRHLISYSGNIGIKQELEVVVQAASRMKGDSAHFVISGDGSDKPRLERMIQSMNLSNVSLLPLLDESDYRALLNNSDICLVTTRPGTGASFLPSKLLNILAAGRPVVTNADEQSALHDAVCQGNFGVNLNNNPDSLASGIRELLQNPDKLAEMGKNGALYVEQFRKEPMLNKLVQVVSDVCEKAFAAPLQDERVKS